MKKVIIVIYIILLMTITYLTIIFKINSKFLANYNKGVYETSSLEKVLIFNLYQPYVPIYNYANALYQTGHYSDASTYYLKALEYDVPEDLVCYIRVNYVLSELKQIDKKMKDNVKLLKYKELREFLYEDNCAVPGDADGSNQGGSNGNESGDEKGEGESGEQSGSGAGESGNENGQGEGENGLESGQGGQGGQAAAEALEGEISDMEEGLDGSGSSSGSQSGNSGNNGNQSGSSSGSGVDQDRMDELQEQNNQAASDRNNANNNGNGTGSGMGATQNPNDVYW